MYRAVVDKVTAAGVWVVVADLVPGFAFGPCQRVGGSVAAGDAVLVVDVSDSPNDPDLVVVGKLI